MKTFLLITILCLIFTVKSFVMSVLSKKHLHSAADAVLINGLIFACVTILFAAFLPGAATPVILFGVVMGALTVLCQISYTTALSVGPLSLTGLVYNLAMLVPIFVSKLRYDEPLSAMRVTGILLSVVALIINTKPGSGGKIPKKWYLFALLAFAFNGLVATTTKIFTNDFVPKGELFPKETYAYFGYAYLTATLLSGLALLLFKAKGKRPSCRPSPSFLFGILGVALLLTVFQPIYALSASVIPGTLLFPAYNGAATLLVTVSGMVLFKEKLSRRQWLGVTTGAIAIVFMCL